MSLRATWRVNYKDNDLAENLIASKRRNLDEKLAKTEGVHFFFSSVTGTHTNAKTSRKEKDKLDVVMRLKICLITFIQELPIL